ncbi:hypothetical protein [Bacillus thermotolerans]|uniref:hypothetical protein n=1 Tax=Bacillus thermotolerans TaxID=1221996 RepID=UPI000589211E|nr:hypothetical protein [Bacillus thermotolerans]KKB44286.1 hypothetical protein QY96_03308 [Bacillus thermotolerans]
MLYEDRKIMKWRGFLLSEHAEQLTEPEVINEENLMDEQAKEAFDHMISCSYHNGMPVTMCIRVLGKPPVQVTGIVQKLNDPPGCLKVAGKGTIHIKDILTVELVDTKDERYEY